MIRASWQRHANFLEKNRYLLHTTIFKSCIRDIEEREAEKAEMLEKDKERRVAELTKKWDDVEAELQRVVDNVCHYLDGTDEKALRQASYENKARLLLMITENYQRSIADEIRVAADKIQLELLPKMKEYQEQAKR